MTFTNSPLPGGGGGLGVQSQRRSPKVKEDGDKVYIFITYQVCRFFLFENYF